MIMWLANEPKDNIHPVPIIFCLFSGILHGIYFINLWMDSDEENGDWQKLLRWIDKIAGDDREH